MQNIANSLHQHIRSSLRTIFPYCTYTVCTYMYELSVEGQLCGGGFPDSWVCVCVCLIISAGEECATEHGGRIREKRDRLRGLLGTLPILRGRNFLKLVAIHALLYADGTSDQNQRQQGTRTTIARRTL